MTSSHPFWPAPQGRDLNATVALPGSKSLTNRELLLSAIASEPTLLIAPLVSRDSKLMIQALESLGVQFQWQGNDLLVAPGKLNGPATIDCGLAGTVMRFVPPLSMLAQGDISFDGDEGARRRPMHTTIDSIRALGVTVEAKGQSLPFTVSGTGRVSGGNLEIDASASSQFVSGLLLVAARFENGLTLRHIGEELPSLPHIEMTLETLRQRGVNARTIDELTWRVEPGTILGGRKVIEPDLSNAGPFLAAAMVSGGEIRIPNWPKVTTQVGAEFVSILPKMGATVKLEGDVLTIQGDGQIHGLDIDLSIGGELAPVIAALAALADSPSRITGIAHLRGHETDRLSALTTELNRLGGNVTELEDGLEIQPAKLHGGKWLTYEDHRMATAAAILGLRVSGIEVENIATTSKTMPEFVNLWQAMLGSN
ncbi:MAG: 3-phosphoshikimate 1-carboxyvinyltransferase [Actinomycetota bacterium]|jgi:3-phosphoshikimate 1-carboxyvinyltransferase